MTENWMPCFLRRSISVVFAKAAPGVYTPPLEVKGRVDGQLQNKLNQS